jgi:hypothetical protein
MTTENTFQKKIKKFGHEVILSQNSEKIWNWTNLINFCSFFIKIPNILLFITSLICSI